MGLAGLLEGAGERGGKAEQGGSGTRQHGALCGFCSWPCTGGLSPRSVNQWSVNVSVS